VKDDQAFEKRGLAAYFTTFLGDEGAPGRVADITGDPEAHVLLKDYVQRALKSGDAELVAWAQPLTSRVGLGAKGLRGRYYTGKNFEKLILERVDPQIMYTQDDLPVPAEKRQNLTVRWTGLVRVSVKGRYTFFVVSDDGHRLWVAGKKLSEVWKDQAATESKGHTNLAPGSHPIKLEYYNGSGEAHIELLWKPPKGEKARIAPEFLRSRLMDEGAGE
jgi:hypothetical protein